MNQGFDVHLYALVRVKVSDVRAADQASAISAAMAEVNLDDVFNRTFDGAGLETANGVVTAVEYADEVQYALVDEHGDAEYARSRAFHVSEDGTWVPETAH